MTPWMGKNRMRSYKGASECTHVRTAMHSISTACTHAVQLAGGLYRDHTIWRLGVALAAICLGPTGPMRPYVSFSQGVTSHMPCMYTKTRIGDLAVPIPTLCKYQSVKLM